MCDCIERALLLRDAIQEFTRQATPTQLKASSEGDDRAEAYSDTTVDTWELGSTEWAALAMLMELLSPIKVLTKELEADTYPVIHAAGRAMLWLALICP